MKNFGFVLILLGLLSCNAKPEKKTSNNKVEKINSSKMNKDTITFGAGCFWCVEAVFQRLKGVDTVQSGYMGGKISNPTYKEVCSGLTGHAEVVQVVFDPEVISFEKLAEVFFYTHDPTTLNRQGADAGTQYRSAIFYHNESQRETAEKVKAKLNDANTFGAKIVTEITPASVFYVAEDYHQNYYNLNGTQPYCKIVINPKVGKLTDKFKDLLK
jgi:peptide-methionine (S)-S-oxide reductase